MDIEHIESQSLNGVSVVKVFFHLGADINRAIAEVVSTLPVLQFGLSSNTLLVRH